MKHVIRSDSYIDDLLTIWDYTAEHSPESADRMICRLEARVDQLARFPLVGERQGKFGASVRRIIVGQYLLFYSVADDRIDILRVIHGSRKMEDLFD